LGEVSKNCKLHPPLGAERYTVDDAVIVNTAKEVWGLPGGGWKNIIKTGKKIIEAVAEVVKSGVVETAAKSKPVQNAAQSASKNIKKALPKPPFRSRSSPGKNYQYSCGLRKIY
jgi:hypothetical protein